MSIHSDETVVYVASSSADELRQGEIVSNVVLYTPGEGKNVFLSTEFPFAIILSQDCDLLADFNLRTSGHQSDLTSIILYELEPFDQIRPKLGGSDLARKAKANQSERYHFLESAPPSLDSSGVGLPPLMIDFKRFFCLPPAEVYGQVESGAATRRCRLEMPYREHLQARAAFYFHRVGLPRPHRLPA